MGDSCRSFHHDYFIKYAFMCLTAAPPTKLISDSHSYLLYNAGHYAFDHNCHNYIDTALVSTISSEEILKAPCASSTTPDHMGAPCHGTVYLLAPGG